MIVIEKEDGRHTVSETATGPVYKRRPALEIQMEGEWQVVMWTWVMILGGGRVKAVGAEKRETLDAAVANSR